MVVRRFLSVFFPAAEYLVTTRITRVEGHPFKTEGKVLVNPGWLAVYGKEGQEGSEGNLVAVNAGEKVKTEDVSVKANETKPPPRYSEATLLSAMEGAGKMVDDEELKAAMAGRGLGTPATRAQIIESLIGEQYMHREGRELIPTAKAFSLMTLLHGLGINELTQPELTGDWEWKLGRMRRGEFTREEFMARDRRDDPAHRRARQDLRQRHHSRRLRRPQGALPQVRRPDPGNLQEIPVRQAAITRCGRSSPAASSSRPRSIR